MKKNWMVVLGLLVFAAIITVAVILLVKKFERDRQSAMNFEPRSMRLPSQTGPHTTTRTYTQKELEEARKTGKLSGTNQPYTPANATGDAAIQRSLRTLEEINRINEMNRRIVEQQQRQGKQN